MNKYDEKWEQQINELLDGELSQTASEKLKSAAGDDRELASAIVEAYQLQQAMETVKLETAPASLTRRLKAIPAEQRSYSSWLQPRWAMALAVVPLVVIGISLSQPQTPSAVEIAQAKQDLAVAFAYLEKASNRTSYQIESQVGGAMTEAVTGTVLRNFKSQNESSKEKEA